MNFSYAVIAIVGVLAAITLGFIAISPDDIPEPRMASIAEKLPGCTKDWNPMCGVDGITYGNPCMFDTADVKLDYEGECIVPEPEVVEEVPEVVEEVPEVVEEVPEVVEEVPEVVEEVPEVVEEVPEVVEEVMEPEATPEPTTEALPTVLHN